MKRATDFEKKRGLNNPVKVDVLSQMPLKDMQRTIGKTWLDSELKSSDGTSAYSGFGEDMNAAKLQRRKFLMEKGIIAKEGQVTNDTLKALKGP